MIISVTEENHIIYNSLMIRCVFDQRSHSFDTFLWKRQYKPDGFDIYVKGDLIFSRGLNCKLNDTVLNPETSDWVLREEEKLQELDQPDSSVDYAMLLPSLLFALVVILLLVLVGIRHYRRQVRRRQLIIIRFFKFLFYLLENPRRNIQLDHDLCEVLARYS